MSPTKKRPASTARGKNRNRPAHPGAAALIEHVDPASLKPDPRNPRKIAAAARARLKQGMERFGMPVPLLARAEDRVVIGGHQRLAIALELGWPTVPVILRPGLTVSQATALNVLLNNPQAQGEWDDDLLASLLAGMDADDRAVSGFDDDDLARLLKGDRPQEAEGVDLTPPARPKSKVGELYELGRHRLLCGDSRDVDAVRILTGGGRPRMAYNDPPYGVEIVNEAGADSSGLPTRLGLGTAGGSKPFGSKKGKVFDDSSMRSKQIIPSNTYEPIIGDNSTETAIAAYNICAALKIPVMIFWGAQYYAEALPPSSCWIVWDKDNGASFFGDAELAWTNQKTAVRIFKHTWNGLIKGSERGERRVHPTQKPVALAEWCFERYGERGDTVLDLFGGSGSALIAAERTDRTAFVMELAPGYCDVIRRRYSQLVSNPSLAP